MTPDQHAAILLIGGALICGGWLLIKRAASAARTRRTIRAKLAAIDIADWDAYAAKLRPSADDWAPEHSADMDQALAIAAHTAPFVNRLENVVPIQRRSEGGA